MKSILFTFTLMCVVHLANAQKLKLNRTIDIDTLHISLDFDSTIDSFSKSYIDSNFRDAISQFNASEDAFYIVDSLSTRNHFLSMTMRPIQFVKIKGQIINSLYNLALVPFHYFLLKEQKFTVPLLPLFIQAKSRIDYIPSRTLFLHKEKNNRFWIGGKGFLRKKQRQHANLLLSSNQDFYKFFCLISAEDQRRKKKN